jgi:hypothetical protein
MKNIFDKSVTDEVIDRINRLTPENQPVWGKMNAGQMLAHCSVTYDYIYDPRHQKTKAKGLKKFLLKALIKKGVCGEKPYPKNGRTAPQFLITDQKDFEKEKSKLIGYIKQTQEEGAESFDGKESHSFGVLNTTEWNNMFYKHLDHHLTQFGV